ncbi:MULTISPECIES: phage tail protein [unclassified Nostoc]|uniref:phage tail protein n=1 Tax=unclassified Nostoc TaxID=2593658 RepID=UPI002AD34DCC|nr:MULTISPECIES: phage tail protein [unclassified Nostoc]MDZ8124262.1 phage tail protein [Nostoc sp. CmiVER01]MDZ8228191.1 phage tail protein [Nostoc sp. ChiVER01]
MTDNIPPTQVSNYLQYLPAIFQEDVDHYGVNFIGRFLLAFEKIITGLGDVDEPGIEEILDGIIDPTTQEMYLAGIHRYFEPGPGLPASKRSPPEFLEWLASWVALHLREDWNQEDKRRLISSAVPLYRKRGTKAGIEEMLNTYISPVVEIYEFHEHLQVNKISTVGIDTILGGGFPHYFLVKIFLANFGEENFNTCKRQQKLARSIIDQEKPAHTDYDFEIEVPLMQLGVRSTIGIDTILASPASEIPAIQLGIYSTVGVDTILGTLILGKFNS